MLNSGKKFGASRDKIIKYSTSCVVREKKFLSETKNHNPPPPFKLNGRSLTSSFISGLYVIETSNSVKIIYDVTLKI